MLGVMAIGALVAVTPAMGQVLQPPFDSSYTLADLGTPMGVASPLGGLTLKANDPNTLLIGGAANTGSGAIYAVPLVRTDGHVTGFAGAGVQFATAPNIDGGLSYGPGGVLFFTRYPIHELGQILPGSSVMNLSQSLSMSGGLGSSVGALQFVPPGYGAAGQLALASYNSWHWARATLAPSSTVPGAYDVTSIIPGPLLQGGPEGIIYVPAGSPHFPKPSILLSEYSASSVSAWEVDATGDPIPGTRRVFITGLAGAEGAYIEASTGDFFFSTFNGGNRVIVVRGFAAAPCPGDVDGDGFIGFADLNAVLSAFNTVVGQPAYNAAADFDEDGDVDFGDLNVVLSAFNTNC